MEELEKNLNLSEDGASIQQLLGLLSLIVTQLISTFTWRALFGLQVPIGLFVLYCLQTDDKLEETSKPFKMDRIDQS